jgi:PAS domain S-box-containing protein
MILTPVRTRHQSGDLAGERFNTPMTRQGDAECSVGTVARLDEPDSAVNRAPEEALRRESEWLRVTLESIGDAVIATDAVGRVTFLNPIAERLTGWRAAEALGRPLGDVFHIVSQTTRGPVENPALRALQEGIVVGLANHTILIARDGSEHPIDDSAAPIRDEAGRLIGAVLVFRDVAERKRVELERARLAAIVESSDDAIVSKTLDGVIRTWNGGAERIFGWTAAEAVGKPITLIIPPERVDEEKQILARLVRGERIDHFETVRVAKDGRRLDISLTVSPLRDSEGGVVGASKVARDVTQQKQATATNAKFKALFEQATQFAGILSLDGVVVEANRLCLEGCGFRRENVIGKPFWDCGWWDGSLELKEMIRAACRTARNGATFRIETKYFIADGSQRWVDFIMAPVMDDAGKVLFLAPTGTDVTERKRLEEELRRRAEQLIEADQKKDDFIALLAHELRNPLAPVRNGLQVMKLAPGDVQAVAQVRDMMDRQLTHMVRIIDDLLDVSRIGRNKMDLRIARVSLEEVVRTAAETAAPTFEAAGVELQVSLPSRPVQLDADHTRLAQVFSNLLSNSAKYTRRRGRVWLKAKREGREIVVSVMDTGIGIPPEALPSIFDMFSQVDRSIERSTGGLGIGLALVKGLTEMHGGTVSAASEGVNKGTTFTVRLPIAEETLSSSDAPFDERAKTAPRRRRILVADDNRDSAESMAIMLELLQNDVVTAHDGLDVLAKAEEFRPEVILMDVGMPKLNGLETTKRLRERPWTSDVKIIAVTGWGQEGDRDRTREAGCNGHLVKPISLNDLQRLLDGDDE